MRSRTWGVMAAGAGIVMALLAAAGSSHASNMGFRQPKDLFRRTGIQDGRNLVALPARSPYQGQGGLARLCSHLALGPDAQIIQFSGGKAVYAFKCDQVVETFTLLDGRGVMIIDVADRIGTIVGSDDPQRRITLFDTGPTPIGINLFPVDFHTLYLTPEDLCVDCALSAQAIVSRFVAQSGNVLSHKCGQTPQWNLVPGEALLILEPEGPKTCVPAHY